MYSKVKDAPGFVRGDNKAVLSVDNAALKAYKTKKNKQNELQAAISDINDMKIEMSVIKSMLTQLINRS